MSRCAVLNCGMWSRTPTLSSPENPLPHLLPRRLTRRFPQYRYCHTRMGVTVSVVGQRAASLAGMKTTTDSTWVGVPTMTGVSMWDRGTAPGIQTI